MPSAATIRDDLDAAMDSNDPLYGASSLRDATKETLLQSLGDVLAPLIGSGAHIAAVPPTVNDDSGDGYAVGDRWIDTSAGDTFTLVDATVGAAVWVQENGGGGGGAPTTADYLVKTSNGSLSAERVVTDTASVVWDWATGGQAKATVPDASTAAKGIVELATNGETSAGVAVQGNDSRLTLAGLGGAPDGVDYLVKTASGSLSAERVVTDTSTVAVDWATAGQAKPYVPANAITNVEIRQGAATSVIGVTGGSTANVADIAASTDEDVLVRRGGTLGFGPISEVHTYDTAQTNTSLSVPTWARFMTYFVVSGAGGGGGGRGAAAGPNGGGGCGGSASTTSGVLPVINWPATIYVTVGAGGTAGTGGNNANGGAGGAGAPSWITTDSAAVSGSAAYHLAWSGTGGNGGSGGVAAGGGAGGSGGGGGAANTAVYSTLGTVTWRSGATGPAGGGSGNGVGGAPLGSNVVNPGGGGGGSGGNGGAVTAAGQFAFRSGGAAGTTGGNGVDGIVGSPWAAVGGTGGGGGSAGPGGNGGNGANGCPGGGGAGSVGGVGGNGGAGGAGYVLIVFSN